MSWKKVIGAIMTSAGLAITAFHIAVGSRGRGVNEQMIGISIFIAVFGIFIFLGNFKKQQGS